MTREELLMLFTDPSREGLKTPFVCDNYAWASDAYVMLFLPKLEGDTYTESKKANPYIPLIDNQTPPITYSTNDLKELLGEKEMEPIYEEKECKECNGSGTVEYKYFSSTTRKSYEIERDCPACDGDGTLQGEKIGEQATYKRCMIRVHNALFNSYTIKYIIDVCEFYNKDTFDLVSESFEFQGHLFHVGEAYVLVMPASHDDGLETKQLNPKI